MYFINLIKEIYIWFIVWRVGSANSEYLEKNGLKVDWVGRMYTVINLPEEIATNAYSQEPYVLEQLRQYDQIMIQMNLADLVIPEFEKIPGSDAYLLVLCASRDYLNIWSFLWSSGLYTLGFFVIKIFYNFGLANGWFDSISNFLTKYL